uniref:Gibberellin regulated protein n=1 Tax=Opuntia streptacantha TaxID=393608 RepID=A0A7C9DXP4_OPUST
MKKVAIFCILFIILLQAFINQASSSAEYATSLSNKYGSHETVHHTEHSLGSKKSVNRTCHYACKRRCKASSRQKICHRACRSCCMRCKCVPPGYSGNKHVCPCYARLTTHGGRPKCP